MDRHSAEVSELDRELAPGMSAVALTFLLITGAFLHLTEGQMFSTFGARCLIALGLLYLLLIAEMVVHYRAGSKNMGQHKWFLLIPFMRLCPRDHIDGSHIWIPWIGWRKRSRHLEDYLTRLFSGPQIFGPGAPPIERQTMILPGCFSFRQDC